MPAVSKIRTVSRSPRLVLNILNKTQNNELHSSTFGITRHLQHAAASSYCSLPTIFHSYSQHRLLTQRRSFWNKVRDENTDQESGLPIHHPEKGVLVYTGRFTNMVRNLKMVSLSTSVLAAGFQPFILRAAKDDFMFKAGLTSFMLLAVFSTPVLVHFVTKKYVTDIYFNQDTKTFTLARKSFFLRRKEFQYVADDVKLPFIGGMFVTHTVNGLPYFIEESEFRSKDLYIHMVGYDKPIDLGIKDPNAHMKPKKKFGLFEHEEGVEKQSESQEDAKLLWKKSKFLHDDDDDDVAAMQTKKGAN